MNKNYNNIYASKPRINDNFYAHVNHEWLNTKKIPDDDIKYTSFIETQNKINAQLKKSFEDNVLPIASTLYSSFTNKDYRNNKCLDELKNFIKIVDNVKSINDLIKMATRLVFVNVNTLFSLSVDSNIYDSENSILYMSQTTLGLSELSYYQDKKYKNIKQKYYDTICLMYQEMYPELSIDEANKIAKSIIDIETKLSIISLTNVERRDADDISHTIKLSELADKYPKLHANSIINILCSLSNNVVNKSHFNEIILEHKNSDRDYFSQLELMLEAYPISSWIEYFKFRIMLQFMNLTNDKMNDLHFDLFKRTIKGQKKHKDITNYATRFTCLLLSDPISRLYVKNFSNIHKEEYVIDMFKYIKKATHNRISKLDWMTHATKKEALYKLSNMRLKVGYSKTKPRNYDHIVLNNSLINNSLILNIDNTIYHLKKLKSKIDINEWDVPSFIVNAYYNPPRNEIIFPASILNEPFLDLNEDFVYNYGHLGSIIGHEIIHGFDDNGSQYDAYGNIKNWWTPEDKKNYKQKVKKIVDIYNNIGVNGKLTAGENIADFGAVIMPLYGLIEKLNNENIKINVKTIQKFYIEYSKHWKYLIRNEYADNKILNDPHSFAYMRVNIPLKNQKLFQTVFNIKPSDKMYIEPNEYLTIW